MTGKPADPDSALDTGTYSVAAVESIAKNVIKAAAYADRWPMWDACQTAMKDAAASSAEYPWQAPEEITVITARSAIRVLKAMLEAVDDPGERKRLATVVSREAEKAEARAAGEQGTAVAAGKYPLRHCAACGKPYRPRRPHSTYCGPNCRAAAYRATRASRQGVPVAR